MSNNITLNTAQLAKVQLMLSSIGNEANKVLYRAINKTIGNTQTKAVDEVYKQLSLTKKRIKQDFNQTKANSKKLSGKLRATGEPVGLINFSATQTKKGVSVKVKRVGSKKLLKHAYIAQGKGGKNHVWWRTYSGPRRPWKWKATPTRYGALPAIYRGPIERLTGPRIEDIYSKPVVLKTVQTHADQRMGVNMEQELNYVLSKL